MLERAFGKYKMKQKAYFNWSSGKDSALALYQALKSEKYDIATLFTVVDAMTKKIPMHEIDVSLLKKQAACIGLPLRVFDADYTLPQEAYSLKMKNCIDALKKEGIECALFGDLYLEELRNKRAKNCKKANISAEFPLWDTPKEEVLKEFLNAGFQAVITCVDGSILDKSFVGKILDNEFIASISAEADICGENGEYHSFVFDGPIFQKPLSFHVNKIYYKDYVTLSGSGRTSKNRFWYADIK